MSKPFYADYVRYHTRRTHPKTGEENGVLVCGDSLNTTEIVCIDILSGFCVRDKEILPQICNASTGLVGAIKSISEKEHVPLNALRTLANRYEKAFTKRMGLFGG